MKTKCVHKFHYSQSLAQTVHKRNKKRKLSFRYPDFLQGSKLPAVQLHRLSIYTTVIIMTLCLQCFDAVGWAAGRASGP